MSICVEGESGEFRWRGKGIVILTEQLWIFDYLPPQIKIPIGGAHYDNQSNLPYLLRKFDPFPFLPFQYGLFMLEAILIFSPHSSLLSSSARSVKVKYHWLLQVVANVLIALGFVAIYYNKNINSKPHFTTWHGCVGGTYVKKYF